MSNALILKTFINAIKLFVLFYGLDLIWDNAKWDLESISPYILSVSFGSLLSAIYYTFLWDQFSKRLFLPVLIVLVVSSFIFYRSDYFQANLISLVFFLNTLSLSVCRDKPANTESNAL